MSTRSYIGMVHTNPKNFLEISYVYCHWDGYLGYNGKILNEYYTNPKKVETLINHGHISSLAPSIGSYNSFEKTNREVCLFYGRDRGEKYCQPITTTDIWQAEKDAAENGAEFLYLYLNGKWYYKPYYHFGKPHTYQDLNEALKKMKQ